MSRQISWTKGHGTENDFVLLLDTDQSHADLDAATVRELCDRRKGVGADGVLRAVPVDHLDEAKPYVGQAAWFMDFRNADGSIGEMCGNGVRVFTRFLVDACQIDPRRGDAPIATRAGIKWVRFEDSFHEDGALTVDMGPASFPPSDGLVVTANGRTWPGVAVDMGNPHAVVFVDDLADPGPLVEPPTWFPTEVFPAGVNIEFAVRLGPRQLAMRVHERGVGETRSCGTGACAVAAVAVGADDDVPRPATCRVDVPGGRLDITVREDGHLEMTGPAVLTGRGESTLHLP